MDIVLSQQKPSCEDFIATTWAIWNARNSNAFRDKIIPHDVSCSSAKDILTRFHEANPQTPKGKNASKEKQKLSWISHEYGSYKVNVDGACDTSKRVACMWIVVRDWEGKFIAGYAERLPEGSSPIVTEALAILNGMKRACDLNLHRELVEAAASVTAMALKWAHVTVIGWFVGPRVHLNIARGTDIVNVPLPTGNLALTP
ncbi:hypothetical protein U1Q18_017143 [Sarracenia purpurea var. burkii]